MVTCIPRVDGLSMDPRVEASQSFSPKVYIMFLWSNRDDNGMGMR